jgi:hypothetical protein
VEHVKDVARCAIHFFLASMFSASAIYGGAAFLLFKLKGVL